MDVENWKIIDGFDAYEVSDLGRVRRIKTGGNRTYIGKVLTPWEARGYLYVRLCQDGKHSDKLVHRLVAQGFIPNPLNLPEVNHLSTKNDCRATMLKWISVKDHGRDSALRGQKRQGGVSFAKDRQKWRTYYNPEPNKREYIGCFDTYEEARAARDAKLKELCSV